MMHAERGRRLLGRLANATYEGVVSETGLFAPGMAERRRGAILIVSSLAGNQPMARSGVYAATKAAATSFGEALHEELRPAGVAVTVLCPGAVATKFAEVAAMEETMRRLPTAMVASAEGTARAGLDALDGGRRHVVPGRGSQLLQFAGRHAPRGLWLRASSRLTV
jgi:short-subunit dehydrogenase